MRKSLYPFVLVILGYGLATDGTTLYANASICTVAYKPMNPPICIDLDLPSGYSKSDITVDQVTDAPLACTPRYPMPGSPAVTEQRREQSATKGLMSSVLSHLKHKVTKK